MLRRVRLARSINYHQLSVVGSANLGRLGMKTLCGLSQARRKYGTQKSVVVSVSVTHVSTIVERLVFLLFFFNGQRPRLALRSSKKSGPFNP